MNLPKEEIVVVGDQLLTDVLGGNRGGLYTILVIPVVESDGFYKIQSDDRKKNHELL